jgi:predicted component of type VI protein secretion system
MVQLKVLSGKMAGAEQAARHFPFRIGRVPTSDLCLEEDGVWDEHLELTFDPRNGFVLTAQANALTTVNGQPLDQAVLRNGDTIEIGALKIRFWLGQTRQASLAWREWLTWAALALITAGQVALIYRLAD